MGACNFKKLSDPFIREQSNRPAQAQGFNAKNGFEKYALSPKILAKMCQILLFWFGRAILKTFLVISWDSVHIFQNRFQLGVQLAFQSFKL